MDNLPSYRESEFELLKDDIDELLRVAGELKALDDSINSHKKDPFTWLNDYLQFETVFENEEKRKCLQNLSYALGKSDEEMIEYLTIAYYTFIMASPDLKNLWNSLNLLTPSRVEKAKEYLQQFL